MENQQKTCSQCKGVLLDDKTPDTRKSEIFQGPCVTCDALVLRKNKTIGNYDILLITRKFDPHKGSLAFPGGFVDYNEDPKDAVLRELEEECDLKGKSVEMLTVRSDPKRDKRKHIVSIFYLVEVDENAQENAGDDAAFCKFYNLDEIKEKRDIFAFDHFDVLTELIQKKKLI